ncbi:hypothetical protein Tco_0616120 [Tanacetum coccineum]
MRTRLHRNFNCFAISTILKRRNRRCSKQIVEPKLRTIIETPVATMADTRTMSELLQAPTEGYGDAIVINIPAILARKILSERLVTILKLTNQELLSLNFQQKFDETFSEAWDRFKDLLRKCPHHGFSELHQIDTFYNALTQSNQDSLNAATGGNLFNRTPRDALTIIENKSKEHPISGVAYDGPTIPPTPSPFLKEVERETEIDHSSGSYHASSSPSFTPFEGGDFILEEIETCLSSDSIPPGIDDSDFDPKGDIRLLEKLLNDDPSSPLPPKELNFEELKMIKSSIDDL